MYIDNIIKSFFLSFSFLNEDFSNIKCNTLSQKIENLCNICILINNKIEVSLISNKN